MLLVRILLGLLLGYAVLVFLAWAFQERIAFPAPRGAVPDPRQVGAANGERIELMMRDGTKLAGWYLTPRGPAGDRPGPPWPALLWFYGNGENIASIGAIVRDFQPPGAALPVVDYPGYGGSGGRATAAASDDAAAAHVAAGGRSRGPGRAGLDPGRRTQRHLRPRWGSLPSQAVAVRAGRRAGQMTLTGTIRSRPCSKRRSASSSVR